MLDQEFQYYRDHQTELVEKYENKFLVIVGDKVIGAYNTKADAYQNAIAKHPLGTFLIQHCTPGIEGYTKTFHSRVVFQ